ncbi:MAG TPA: IclR family transcriptional regulator C-terminal domain-containing protein [Acidocella sp.]|nr:IclR family transcriptional regulator C-terminal domain-containing protein [Acidocella sp.]
MTVQALLKYLARAGSDGHAANRESSAPGLSAIAAAIQKPGTTRTIGALSIAGPATRLPEAQLHALAPDLLAAAAELSAASLGSGYFGGVRHLSLPEEGTA